MTPDQPSSLPWGETAPEELDIAVVGGGFSGLLTLIHLRRAHPHARLALFERRMRPGPGVAYGSCGPTHLLNVPAARMGAFPDDVAAFHGWLAARWPGRFAAGDFVPRRLYGDYLLELAATSLAAITLTGTSSGVAGGSDSPASRPNTWLVRDAIVHLERLPTRVELLRASGSTCVARGVVLAPGLPQARAPWTAVDQGVRRHLLVSDPWEERGYEGLAPDAAVMVVGSGLTAVDVVLELRRRGHRGSILMLSRNGRLPLPHALPGEPPEATDPLGALEARTTTGMTGETGSPEGPTLAPSPSAVFRAVRAAVRRRRAQGFGWEAVIDALRPKTTEIWRGWSSDQRRSFLRRLRPFWEIHRHRAPRDVLAALEAMRSAGVLTVERGAIARLESAGGEALRVIVSGGAGGTGAAGRTGGTGSTGAREGGRGARTEAAGERTSRSLVVARLFNCVGPAMGVRDTIDPLLGSLLRNGLARPDDTGMGFECDDAGRLISAGGVADPGVVLVGALRRGTLWESTAVPELRVQAKRAAEALGAVASRVGSDDRLNRMPDSPQSATLDQSSQAIDGRDTVVEPASNQPVAHS